MSSASFFLARSDWASRVSPSAFPPRVVYASAPSSARHKSRNTGVAKAFARIDRFVSHIMVRPYLLGPPTADQRPETAGAAFSSRMLTVDAHPHRIIPHALDIAGLFLDLLRRRVRPLVVHPATASALGDIDDLLDQQLATLVLQA